MTLLTLVAKAAIRLSLPEPAAVAASTDLSVKQLLSLVNQAGSELARRHGWQALTKEKTFTAVAAETQTDTPIASDFDRIIDETAFNRTQKRRLTGPLNAEEWQEQKSITASVMRDGFRIRGGLFLMIPNPTVGDTIAYEYVSSWWVDTNGGSTWNATAFAGDDDTSALDEEMLAQDLVWRFRKAKGLSYAEDFQTAQVTIAGRIARDGGRKTMDLGQRPHSARPGILIPEGSWSL